ncbi:peptidoglycan editing factor PgeF [Cyanobacterium stanieri LEGE 03274]|uniref:Purine nucleoside phosphorylase n=1 Tax=Cyanobacterium stanieri LEGE 03274 TaxID=1828756 RepID=A0ABR9V225_9CHRO|nr:peptidoglycan editing factor PgeF [Cyanobacterium stanieri]MBE9221166.1 peptidoglycan editing factor PgeF [Cyanobacterium stanieri LEGE 03274]
MAYSSSNHSQWQWKSTPDGEFLTCDLLKDWCHGFFSVDFAGQPPSMLSKYLHKSANVFRLKQIHSNILFSTSAVETKKDEEGNITYSQGDGIISEKAGDSVWVASADCTPVLIADRTLGKVCAIHSGWRGTALKIVPDAITLFNQLGSKKEDLLFALGPAINGEVYQVDIPVALKVLSTIFKGEDQEILQQGYNSPHKVILGDKEEGKVKLDVTQVIHTQIQQQGINKGQIAIAPYCTYQTPARFFSYRRTHQKQVQWSGIISP